MSRKEEVLKSIREIIGGKKFTFSDAYMKRIGQVNITVGRHDMSYFGVTKKYLFVNCFAVFQYREESDEYGYDIRKFPIVYNRLDGQFVKKLELDDLFTCDLEKILADITYYLWWENEVRKPEIMRQLEECKSYEKLYEKAKKVVAG